MTLGTFWTNWTWTWTECVIMNLELDWIFQKWTFGVPAQKCPDHKDAHSHDLDLRWRDVNYLTNRLMIWGLVGGIPRRRGCWMQDSCSLPQLSDHFVQLGGGFVRIGGGFVQIGALGALLSGLVENMCRTRPIFDRPSNELQIFTATATTNWEIFFEPFDHIPRYFNHIKKRWFTCLWNLAR